MEKKRVRTILTDKQRKLYAGKLIDLAHLALGAFTFGQFFSGQPFSLSLALVGIIVAVYLYYISYLLTKQRR